MLDLEPKLFDRLFHGAPSCPSADYRALEAPATKHCIVKLELSDGMSAFLSYLPGKHVAGSLI